MAAFKFSRYLVDIGTLQNYAAAQTSWPGLGESLREKAQRRLNVAGSDI
jgi:hypothetical protein